MVRHQNRPINLHRDTVLVRFVLSLEAVLLIVLQQAAAACSRQYLVIKLVQSPLALVLHSHNYRRTVVTDDFFHSPHT